MVTEAKHHGLLGLEYARKYKGDENMKYLFEALRGISDTYGLMGEYEEALEYGKECYLVVSELYITEHSDVQQALSQIVEYYSLLGNYSLAYGYAKFNYETLTDPSSDIHSEHYSIGISMCQIANIWVNIPNEERSADGLERSVEAENFARKACVIMLNRYGRDLLSLSRFFKTLADVLEKNWSCSEESRMFLELIDIEYRMKSDPSTYFERNRLNLIYENITKSPHIRIENVES
jgi:tetratricopeptide (TPR) repeat protein